MSRRCLLLAAASLALGGCTVYVPTQPYAPLIRARGQGEVALHAHLSLRPEVALAYSPVEHLVVLGNVAAKPVWSTSEKQTDNFRMVQVGAGLGVYQRLGARCLGMLTLGGGRTTAQRQLAEFLAPETTYEARYASAFGQAALWYQYGSQPHDWLGFGYRLTGVQFQSLSASTPYQSGYRYYELPTTGQLRHELFVNFRDQLGRRPGRWYLQATIGASLCLPGRPETSVPYDPVAERVGDNRGLALLGSVGFIYPLGR